MLLTANSSIIENILNKQRKLQLKFQTLGRERERRKRKREEEEERQHEEKKSYDREQRELEMKITAIKRKIEERKRGKVNVQNNGYRKRQWEDNRRKQFEKRQRVKKKSNRFFDDSDQEEDTRKKLKSSNNKFQPAMQILNDLMGSHLAAPFCKPVDAVKYNIPDYNIKIKKPMDLGTIKANVKRNHYKELWEVWADIRLVWDNCRTYNGPLNPFTIKANALAQIFDARLEELESGNFDKNGIKVKTSSTSRIPFQAERKISENLKKPKFEGPIDISALRKEINNSSVAQLQNVIRILERRGKAVKDKDGNYELDFETLDEETAREIHSFFKEQDTKIESQKLKKLTLKHELDLMESEEIEKLTVSNSGKRTSLHGTSQNSTHLNIESTKSSSRPSKKWPSGVGALSGKMETFEIGNDACTYSSSSSSDEDEDLFKMEEKTAPTEQPATIKSEETSAPKKAIDASLWSTTEADTSTAAATRVVKKYSQHIDKMQDNTSTSENTESQSSGNSPLENVVAKKNLEEPSPHCENTELTRDPINHFEQADILDDLFS